MQNGLITYSNHLIMKIALTSDKTNMHSNSHDIQHYKKYHHTTTVNLQPSVYALQIFMVDTDTCVAPSSVS